MEGAATMDEARGLRTPILIGGLSHSGKTQLRVALGAHPDLEITRRTGLWTRHYGRYGDLRRPRNLDRCLESLVGDANVRQLNPDPTRLRREFLQGEPSYARLFGLLHAEHAASLGKRRWGEQMGGIERYAEPIFEAFPRARFIHMVRDQRSRCAGRAGASGRRGAVGWDTARWVRSVELAARNQRRHPDRYLVLRYEALAARPDDTLRDVCSFLDEEARPEMLAALSEMHLDPPNSSGRLEDRGSHRVFVEAYAGRELERLDYEVGSPALQRRAHLNYLFVDRPFNRAAMTAWRLSASLGSARRAR
jgi:hypothetical protein